MADFADREHELDPPRVAELLAQGWQVVDVRESYEREAGHIGGSRHVALDRIAADAETIDRDAPVIFYCRVGARSGMATQAFRAAGYEAYHLRGGILAWERAGLGLEPAGGHVADH